ncbi:hypothetical protein GCM10010412_082930 [Nonomuraea recticatena]|uniref:Lipoprotein n=1 Tax=Nonomuraea recticatena TaxID=46178 RepID=A0ABN3T2A8_9ACTN
MHAPSPARIALVLTMTAALLAACASSDAPACAATLAAGPPPKLPTGSGNALSGKAPSSVVQPAAVQTRPPIPPARPNVAPARPPVAPAKPALPQSRPTTQATAVPQSAVPYRRDPARSYPTQKRPTYRGAYRHYDGFPGWYPIDVWPIGYADTYGCTMTGIESQPADLDGDGQPDPAAQW